MEEYLQNLRSLRSQMNDIEELSAKRSVEEQRQKTAIEALEKDLFSVASETKRLKAESEELEKEKTQICHQNFEAQKKISSLENETSTLAQDAMERNLPYVYARRAAQREVNQEEESLELLRQQTVSASAGLEEKRMYFAKIMEDLVSKLQLAQDWLNSYKKMTMTTHLREMRVSHEKLSAQIESKKTEYEELKARKSELYDENAKSKQLMFQLEQKNEAFTPALKTLDMEALLEEHKALLADEAGELEYLKSLEDQIKQLTNVSHAVKCQCGEEYMVELMG